MNLYQTNDTFGFSYMFNFRVSTYNRDMNMISYEPLFQTMKKKKSVLTSVQNGAFPVLHITQSSRVKVLLQIPSIGFAPCSTANQLPTPLYYTIPLRIEKYVLLSTKILLGDMTFIFSPIFFFALISP